ncbi:MAG: aminotransferase class I/II-fold pyridoxal phosphate-dependent enzyme, partial [Bacteroidales bacterium]|nr:aminotransferase class I/II-fold pyridoxal phosphate-dependent enzyme [Bacteroidales bacterium]
KDGVMLFSAGFQANSGTIPSVVGRGDYVIYDEMDHASIIEGRRLSFAECLKYKHSDMEDLERVLKRCPMETSKLVVTDGVFSMEGDVCNLPQMVELCDKYQATLMVDEAHSLGVFGKEGRGICDHYGLLDKVDIIMGTFSKSLAAIGGFIATDKDTINWLKHNVRPYIFTASIAPAATASVIAALKIMRSEPERQANLWKVTNHALKSFREAGFEIGHTQTPIIPLYVRDDPKTFKVTRMLLDEGVFVNPVVSPAVPPKDTLIRISWMATHTVDDVDFAVDKIVKCFKKLDLLH